MQTAIKAAKVCLHSSFTHRHSLLHYCGLALSFDNHKKTLFPISLLRLFYVHISTQSEICLWRFYLIVFCSVRKVDKITSSNILFMLIMHHLSLIIITVISKGKLPLRNAFCGRKTFLSSPFDENKNFSPPLGC